PVVRLQTRLLERCFPGNAYGRPVVGSRSCVRSLGPADVVRLMEQEWVSRRALLFIQGSVSSDEVREAVARAYGDVQRSRGEVPPNEAEGLPKGVRVRLDVDHAVSPYVVVGLPVPGAAEEDYLLFLAALNLLLGAPAFAAGSSFTSPTGWLERAVSLRDTVA